MLELLETHSFFELDTSSIRVVRVSVFDPWVQHEHTI